MGLGLDYIINQLNKILGSQEPIPTAQHKSNATMINNDIKAIIETHEQNKRNIINPMLRGMKGRF